MPITEIVRVLATSPSPSGRLDLFYDVSGEMLPDEQTFGWPRFWVNQLDENQALIQRHGPFEVEDEALEFGESKLGAEGWTTP
jgi:hypothetical protein